MHQRDISPKTTPLPAIDMEYLTLPPEQTLHGPVDIAARFAALPDGQEAWIYAAGATEEDAQAHLAAWMSGLLTAISTAEEQRTLAGAELGVVDFSTFGYTIRQDDTGEIWMRHDATPGVMLVTADAQVFARCLKVLIAAVFDSLDAEDAARLN